MKAILYLLWLLTQDASEEALKEERARVPIVREAVKKTAMIVVHVGEKQVPLGSGAVVSADGHVMTCAHVVEAVAQLGLEPGGDGVFSVVLSDGTTLSAKLLGRNSQNDIALLKADGEKLPHFDLSSSRRPKAGDRVLALGYPAGNVGSAMKGKGESKPAPSVALGKVADPNRKFVVQGAGGMKFYPDCVESDVPIFMGNSGGPLVDGEGELLGLNGAIAGAKSFTLSAASMSKCFDDLKAGRDVDGEKAGDGMTLKDYGRLLSDAFGLSESGGERDWLKEPFATVAAARKGGVVPLYRKKDLVGYATVLDSEGRLAASIRALERKGLWGKISDAIDKGVEDNDTLKEWWKGLKGVLGDGGPLEAQLPSGKRVPVKPSKKSAKYGLVLLEAETGDEKLEPIPEADVAKMEPGRWVAVLDGTDAPAAVGLLSAPKHTVSSATKFPLTPGEWLEAWSNEELDPKDFVDIVLFDARLETRQLGTPLVNARGRMLGIAIFHPARGTSYAASVADVRKEFGLDK